MPDFEVFMDSVDIEIHLIARARGGPIASRFGVQDRQGVMEARNAVGRALEEAAARRPSARRRTRSPPLTA